MRWILLQTQEQVFILLRLNLLFSCQSRNEMPLPLYQLQDTIDEKTESPQGHPEMGVMQEEPKEVRREGE